MRRITAYLAAMLAVATYAHAGAIFNLTPQVLPAAPGQTVTFLGTLTNTGSEDLFLNGDVNSFSQAGLLLDDSTFFINAPLFLASGAAYSGPFFDVTVGTNASLGSHSGLFTVQGGVDSESFDNLASQGFSVSVGSSPTVPEPSPAAMMSLAGIAIAAYFLATRAVAHSLKSILDL